MTKVEAPSLVDRLVEFVPSSYRTELNRAVRRLRDRLPPVMIEHRIDALERHVDRRLADMEAKLDELLRRTESKAA
jgi:uncharacterized protein YllA (UPF0747 family)